MQVVDLSADFRLYDVEVYKKWYGEEHKAPELQKEAVYAITEVRVPPCAIGGPHSWKRDARV